jgi:photosystem II stability/assembly factor-like uncharacterized protein
MSGVKAFHLILGLVFYSSLTVFGQWSAATSGTTNNLNGVSLLDSGSGFAVGDAGTILKTTDSGMTWSPVTSGTTNALDDVYFFDPTQGVAVGEQGLIRRTTDSGVSWQTVASGVTDDLRCVSFSGVDGICGGGSNTILYSTDSGASWQISQTGFFDPGFFGAHMLSGTAGFVAGQNLIFEPLVGNSTDGGATWDFHDFHFETKEGGATDTFFFDQNTGVVSGAVFNDQGAVARTTDGGTTWSTSFFAHPLQAIDIPQISSGFAVGLAGEILHSTDAGITWLDQTSGTSANLNDVSFASDAMRGIAVGESGTILWTANGGGGATPTPTATATPTATPRATATPRPRPTPRGRPTPSA